MRKRPETTHVVVVEVHDPPAGEEVTVYEVTASPEVGAVQYTVADPTPAMPKTFVGAPGTLVVTRAVDGATAIALPLELDTLSAIVK